MDVVNVRVNDEVWPVPGGTTLATVLQRVGVPETGVAVAVDDEFVPRAAWHETTVSDDARIEIVTAVQGG